MFALFIFKPLGMGKAQLLWQGCCVVIRILDIKEFIRSNFLKKSKVLIPCVLDFCSAPQNRQMVSGTAIHLLLEKGYFCMQKGCHNTEAYVLAYTPNHVLFYGELTLTSIIKFLRIQI